MKRKLAILGGSLLLTSTIMSSAFATIANPWLIRARAVNFRPKASSSTIATVGGNVTSISNEWAPEIDFNYFFTDNLSLELILSTARHSVTATGTSLGTVNLGKVSHIPPTLTLAYHFLPNKLVNPYVGIGINHTNFYNPSNGPVTFSMNYKSSTGAALDAGFDYDFGNQWVGNFDVKKIYISSNVTGRATGIAPLTGNVKLNPLVVGFGVGYRFG